MKVAILTQPLGHNYGGLLQAYALQTHLKSLGCQVETLDRRSPNADEIPVKRYITNLFRFMFGRIKSVPTSKKRLYVLQELSVFRDTQLTMSPTITGNKELRDYYCKYNFDAFLVGSDQVWRPMYSPCILNYYLDFLNDIKSSAKRLAYAASFGVEEWEYPESMTDKCQALARQFDAISVREKSAVSLCNDKLGVPAKCVVDPTFLLDPLDYNLLIQECDKDKSADSLLCYLLDPSPEKHALTSCVGKHLDTNVFFIKPTRSLTQVRSREIESCKWPSVQRWLQAFCGAKFVVTDSFHGIIFSILFNKPFIAIGNSSRGLTRFSSLLSQFDLLDRLVEPGEKISAELIKKKINWRLVNEKRRVLSDDGKTFLKNHLLMDNK